MCKEKGEKKVAFNTLGILPWGAYIHGSILGAFMPCELFSCVQRDASWLMHQL